MKKIKIGLFLTTAILFFSAISNPVSAQFGLFKGDDTHETETLDPVLELYQKFITDYTSALYNDEMQLDTIMDNYITDAASLVDPGIDTDYEKKSAHDIKRIKKILSGKRAPLTVVIKSKTADKLAELGVKKLAKDYEKAFKDAFTKGYGESRTTRKLNDVKTAETEELKATIHEAINKGFDDLAEKIRKALNK